MTNTEAASIAPGRRIEVSIRGRRFAASVVGRSGPVLDIEPDQPRPGTKGARVNYFTCDVSDVVWASPLWSPMDAVRAG